MSYYAVFSIEIHSSMDFFSLRKVQIVVVFYACVQVCVCVLYTVHARKNIIFCLWILLLLSIAIVNGSSRLSFCMTFISIIARDLDPTAKLKTESTYKYTIDTHGKIWISSFRKKRQKISIDNGFRATHFCICVCVCVRFVVFFVVVVIVIVVMFPLWSVYCRWVCIVNPFCAEVKCHSTWCRWIGIEGLDKQKMRAKKRQRQGGGDVDGGKERMRRRKYEEGKIACKLFSIFCCCVYCEKNGFIQLKGYFFPLVQKWNHKNALRDMNWRVWCVCACMEVLMVRIDYF